MAHAPEPNVDRLLARMGRSLADHSIIVTELDRTILWMNETAERTFGAPLAAYHGTSLTRTFTARDIEVGVPQHEGEIALATGYADNDRWHVRYDGSQFWSSGTLNLIKDEAGAPIAFAKVIRDRTDWKEQQDLLTNQVERLERSGAQHVAVLGTLAHELRSPLAAVVNATAVLRHLATGQLAMSAPLGMLERQLAVIRRQVDDLVDVTRISTGKVNLNLAPIVLQDILDNAARIVLPQDQLRSQRLRLVLPTSQLVVRGDATRLQQVFSNLISNAVKFTPEDGEIHVIAAFVDQHAIVRVVDTGAGIHQDMLPRIFELFTQADHNGAHQGLGIGLALVRELVTLHGGSVQVRSDGPGKGAEFTVRLPLAP